MTRRSTSPRPNIVWIVSEDCPPQFGCYGDLLAQTPNVDRLARRGVVFERAFCSAPVCAPSRFALLTGVASESNAPANHMRAHAAMPSWMRTYPEILRDLGYYCTNNFKTDYNAQVDASAIWAESSKAATWRNRPSGSPFLAVFNFDATHESAVFRRDDFVVDPDHVRLPAYLPDTPEIRQDFAHYYRKVAEFDEYVGQLQQELADDGLAEDTIVIHASDHGGVTPRTKRYCYDEGLRVPLIISAPDRYAGLFPPRGSRVAAPVSTIRIPPTLVDVAGGEIPAYMQGRSLASCSFDPDVELAFGMRNRMDERYDMMRTVRSARFRYIRNYQPHRPYGQHQAFGWLAAGYRSWESEYRAGRLNEVQSAFWRAKPGVELYDTQADPDEVCNLAGDLEHVDVEQRLSAALDEHILAVHDNGFLAEGSPVEGYDASRADGAYPLAQVLQIANAVTRQDVRELPQFLAGLADPDPTVRRWAAIGVLSLGAAGRPAAEPLRATLEGELDPHVVVPCAEALARYESDPDAVSRLAQLADRGHPLPVRLEALNALTALDPSTVLPFRDVIVAAAEDGEHVGAAARYLLSQVDGTYTPDSVIFPMEWMTTMSAQWHKTGSPHHLPEEQEHS